MFFRQFDMGHNPAKTKITKALVIHPDLYAFGGAELVALRMINQLSKIVDHITVIHSGKELDVNLVKKWTNIWLDQSKVVFQSTFFRPTLVGKSGALIKYAFALRSARRVAHDFDLVVSTYGECTFRAKNVIQYIHFPLFIGTRENFHFLGARNLNWFKFVSRKAYILICKIISRWDPDIVINHTTLTNSDWTLRYITRCYNGISCSRLYPGAKIGISREHRDYVPWHLRSNDFVMLGRIVPNKQIEKAINIINRLNNHGFNCHLNIIGNGCSRYLKKLNGLIRGKNISLHIGLSRENVEKIISCKKYGIHAYDDEHYGIAVAEMQMLGCIVFVPNSGGQCEIARSMLQQYSSVDDAVSKITNILKSEECQEKILGEIDQVNSEMSLECFNRRFVECVNERLHQSGCDVRNKDQATTTNGRVK